MSTIDNIMNAAESSQSSESSSIGESASSRTSSIMDMDYDIQDDTDAEVIKEEKEEKKANSTRTVEEEKEETKKEPKKEAKKEKEDKDEDKEDEKDLEKKKEEESTKRKIKYKVDGVDVEEEVEEKDLINDYSGRKALQKRFTQLDLEKKKFEAEKTSLESRNNAIEEYLDGNRQQFESMIADFEKTGKLNKDPVAPLFDMIDKMELDVSKYDQALFYHYVPIVAEFLDMDDAQREAYLVKKENNWLHKKQQSLAAKEESNRQYRAKLEQENSAKKKAGLTEESYSELKSELVGLGLDESKVDVSKVIEWNELRPHYLRSKSLIEKAGKGDVWKVTRILNEFPHTSDTEILDALGYKESVQGKLKEELKDKIPSKPAIKKKTADFTEEEEEFTKYFRR